MSSSPTGVIERVVNQRVVLLLKDGRQFAGRLLGLDEHLNLVLDETEETRDDARRRLGRVVVRGSNVVSLHAPGGPAAPGAP
jgi:small nuclear ribonucleoprotein